MSVLYCEPPSKGADKHEITVEPSLSISALTGSLTITCFSKGCVHFSYRADQRDSQIPSDSCFFLDFFSVCYVSTIPCKCHYHLSKESTDRETWRCELARGQGDISAKMRGDGEENVVGE